jgi:tRNA threonylcarbamoyl adenosine modification protein (Sua5/YciO/YrdC/YwlC family)
MIFAIDLDDTLLDSKDLWEKAYKKAFIRFRPKNGEFWETRRLTPGNIYSLKKHLKVIFLRKNIPLSLIAAKEKEMLKNLEKFSGKHVFKDVYPFFSKMKKDGHYLALVTFGWKSLQSAKLRGTKIPQYLDEINIEKKPKWQVIKKIQNKFPGEMVVFLDDHPAQLEPVLKKSKNTLVVRIMRREGRYNDKKIVRHLADKIPEVEDFYCLKNMLADVPEFLEINAKKPEKRRSKIAVNALKDGKTVLYPTDTLYGLGCDALNKKARQKIYLIKGRPFKKQLPLIVADIKMAKKYFIIDPKTEKFLKKIWPGPVSVVLTIKNQKIAGLLGGKNVVVRIPGSVLARNISAELGRPIVSTSANVSGGPSAGAIDAIIKQFKKIKPELVLDSGTLRSKKPSTILDLTKFPEVHVLRRGAGFEKAKNLF